MLLCDQTNLFKKFEFSLSVIHKGWKSGWFLFKDELDIS
jgi:hypothetical protein